MAKDHDAALRKLRGRERQGVRPRLPRARGRVPQGGDRGGDHDAAPRAAERGSACAGHRRSRRRSRRIRTPRRTCSTSSRTWPTSRRSRQPTAPTRLVAWAPDSASRALRQGPRGSDDGSRTRERSSRMLAAIRSAAVLGIDAYDVTVEVDVALGLPQWTTVGLPASAVKESRERVGAALLNSGFTVPPRRITINLAPADMRKEGTAFDLPIALGVLVGTGVARRRGAGARTPSSVSSGSTAALRPVRGALSIARMLAARRTRRIGISSLVLPRANLAEASLVREAASRRPDDARRAGRLARAPSSADRRVRRPVAHEVGRHDRLRRRRRTGERQARAHDRRRGRARRAAHRTARLGEDDAGAPASDDPPGAHDRRIARGDGGAQRRRPARPDARRGHASSLPRAASFRVHGGARRRRIHRRGPARSVSRITACCSSTSCSSFPAPCSRRCASRWRTASSRSRAPRHRCASRRASRSSPR